MNTDINEGLSFIIMCQYWVTNSDKSTTQMQDVHNEGSCREGREGVDGNCVLSVQFFL